MEGHIIPELADFAEERQAIYERLRACGKLMAAVGDETRQAIMATLLCAPEVGLRVGQITEGTKLSRPAVSHHLKVLREAGAVTLIKRGTRNYYFVDAASSEWEAFWAFADATRKLSRTAHSKGYPDIYEKEELR